jgi:hypothetical protein
MLQGYFCPFGGSRPPYWGKELRFPGYGVRPGWRETPSRAAHPGVSDARTTQLKQDNLSHRPEEIKTEIF